MLSGVWSLPVIDLSICPLHIMTPALVMLPAINKMTKNPRTGILPMFFHIEGLVRLLKPNIHARVGTKIILKNRVEEIPITSVIPTERIGATVTI